MTLLTSSKLLYKFIVTAHTAQLFATNLTAMLIVLRHVSATNDVVMTDDMTSDDVIL